MELADYTDWRLPNSKELFSLIDKGYYAPALPFGHPFTGVYSGQYWSSSTFVSSTANAWFVSVIEGSVGRINKITTYYVWPVRGPVSALPPPPDGMVLIPGGTNAGNDPDFGAYSLTVDTFYMDATHVTKAQWDVVYNWATNSGYSFDNAGSGKAADHPVQEVNWYDAVKWCNARSEMEGRTPAYYTTNLHESAYVYRTGQIDLEDGVHVNWNAGYRLPSDEEWEYAARGGVESKRFPWGDTISHDQANFRNDGGEAYQYGTTGYHPDYETGGTPYTSPVGSFAANGYGLYDMAGNVWAWCFDWHPDYVGSLRVIRGGAWNNLALYCRVGSRLYGHPGSAYDDIGFRAVLPPGQ